MPRSLAVPAVRRVAQAPRTVTVGPLTVYELRPFDRDEPHNLLGKVDLFGVPHHFQAIRVERYASGCQQPVDDPHDRFEDLQALNAGAFDTVQLPGIEGEFAVCIYPFAA